MVLFLSRVVWASMDSSSLLESLSVSLLESLSIMDDSGVVDEASEEDELMDVWLKLSRNFGVCRPICSTWSLDGGQSSDFGRQHGVVSPLLAALVLG